MRKLKKLQRKTCGKTKKKSWENAYIGDGGFSLCLVAEKLDSWAQYNGGEKSEKQGKCAK